MTLLKCIVLCVGVLAACLRSAHAVSKEEKEKILEILMPSLAECGKEFSIKEEAIAEARENNEYDDLDTCFFACVFRKTEFMDEKGLFDNDKAVEKSKVFFSDEDDLKNLMESSQDCAKVNKETVSDGEKGCERAKLMVNCFTEHKHKFGL